MSAEEPSQSAVGVATSLPPPPDTQPATPTESSTEDLQAEDLMLRWEDHHKSFFELAEDLCHQEQFIDVTISCGDHNFPAHKLILSVCSPYFKNLFLRNPCKHPIVVLKDVHFKYMKLLLIFMYRGEVAVPQEDLPGLLKVARSLQVRGLAEMGSPNPAQVSPRKRYLSEMMADSDLESREGEDFSIDEVKSKLHGQLEIQAVSGASPLSGTCRTPPLSSWLAERAKYLPTSSSHYSDTSDLAPAPRSSRSESGPSEDEPHSQFQPCKREVPDSWTVSDNGSDDTREKDRQGEELIQDYQAMLKRGTRERSLDGDRPKQAKLEPSYDQPLSLKREFDTREESVNRKTGASTLPSSSSLIDAARAAGLDIPPTNSDPMSSISALLAAAQATGGIPATTSSGAASSTSTSSTAHKKPGSSPTATGTPGQSVPAGPSQGLDLSNPAAAMANVNAQMQLYYYMQKLQTAGMGNPKERKECPICGKTLYDRSTWNRHMRIHTGEKPYPCRYCGRRFRTNYNKLGHEKKCPDRHARAILQPTGGAGLPAEASPGVVPNVVYR